MLIQSGSAGAAEDRDDARRDDAVVAREQINPGPVWLQSLAGMQEEQWPALAAFLDLKRDTGNGKLAAQGKRLGRLRGVRHPVAPFLEVGS